MWFYLSETAVKKFGTVYHHVGYLHIEVIGNRSEAQQNNIELMFF